MKEQKAKMERITLKPEEVSKLDGWIDQLTQVYPGISISRADLVGWLVFRQTDLLKPTDKSQLKDRFFDDVKHAEWLLKQLKEAKKRGEATTISKLLSGSELANQNNAMHGIPNNNQAEE